MTFAETILPEFDQEMANTRKVLERLPDDKLDWQPHPKSHTIGWNANHVADIVHWLVVVLTTTSLDIAPVGGPPYQFPKLASRQEILDLFDRNVAAARKAIAEVKDEDMGQPVDAVAGRPTDLHHAALGRGPRHGPQSPDPPSRPPLRLLAAERRTGPRDVRAVGR